MSEVPQGEGYIPDISSLLEVLKRTISFYVYRVVQYGYHLVHLLHFIPFFDTPFFFT